MSAPNPKDAVGLTKPALRLVPPALTIHVAQAMADGAGKYGPYNWREHPVRLTVYIEAAMRHLLALLDGEDRARDSKHLHAAHVAACMAIVLDALETGNLIDDRTSGPAADIIERLSFRPTMDLDEPIPFTPTPMPELEELPACGGASTCSICVQMDKDPETEHPWLNWEAEDSPDELP